MKNLKHQDRLIAPAELSPKALSPFVVKEKIK
jgi:hypothetical protein